MKVNQIITTTQERELWVDGITLLSAEEFEMYKEHILPLNCPWWLRSHVCGSRSAALVDTYGYVYRIRVFLNNKRVGVRPALITQKSYDLQIGDKFSLFDYTWTVISDNLALCDDCIGKSPFRKDYEAEDARDYEASDVKKFLEAWMSKKMREEEMAG